ncbi:MAG: UDP-N-acetylmuramate--L-alanine ligase [Bacilli bacterium]|nr:UDP-N-acetylmuramate--L-alanine ligase [Bacilli bacterium]
MKYYCIGIKGAGMSTLANILFDLGNEVSGYDDSKGYKFTMEGLNARGIEIFYDAHEIDKDTIVTYSKAFSPDHKEIKRVKELGLTIKDYNEVVGDITKMFTTIGVCGTHGKTTTSLLISNIFNNTLGCNYFVGDGTGHATTDNKFFVIESDEYNKHFLAYHPTVAIITNIELDHVECYPGGIQEIRDTFETFGNKANLVIACGDDENIRMLNLTSDTIYYGFDERNNVVAKNVVLDEKGSKFDCYIDGELYGNFEVPLFGKHMILNALSAIAVAKYYGISIEDTKKYINEFQGAKRRFKLKEFGDVVTVDDYAHHPTEIEVTLSSARQKYPNKEIVGVFLPNTYSRTEALMDDFVEAMSKADKAYVMDIHCDRERQEDYPGVSSDTIMERVPNCEKVSVETCEKLLKHKNAVICFMSCTNIYVLEEEFERLINNK